MARLNLVLIPNFWLPHAREGGTGRAASAETQLPRPVPDCTPWEEEVCEEEQEIAAGIQLLAGVCQDEGKA